MKKTVISILFLSLIIINLTACNLVSNNDCTNRENKEKILVNDDNIYAVWVSYNELKMSGEAVNNEEAFTDKADRIMRNCREAGFNRVIVQVRPFSDAFYYSDIFPMSAYLSGAQGEDAGYDALRIMCEKAHIYNLKIDAWINPYRVSYDTDINKLSKSNPARIWLEQGKTENVSVTDRGIFYNPASAQVQKLVLDGINEILTNYDADGIHIDDYFYPTKDESFDRASYIAFTENGGKLSLEDWRRESTDNLVSLIYSTVKSYDGNKLFSVSPCGDINKNINDYYADVALWCSEEGYCDVIMPQLYYGFENENKPFLSTLEEWKKLIKSDSVRLCAGLAFYKYGCEDKYAGSGSREWQENDDIVSRQVNSITNDESLSGFSLYSYSYVFSENNDEICKKELQKIKNMLK